MQKKPMISGAEGSRRAGWVAIVGLITLGLVLGLGSFPAQAAQLTVSWSDATPDDHTGFKVERKTGTTGAFAQIASTGATEMAYVDTTLTAGTTYCYRVRAYNAAGDSPYTPEACAAAPTAVLRTLTVAKSGTGTGTVDTSPAGISCGSTCSATYASGTSVALSATPTTGSTFTGWSGACTGTGGCAVVLDANKNATATFALSTATTYALTVTKAGTGSGTVTSSPSGITCGSTCSANYNSGTSVTLTAAASAGSTFSGWSGACTGTGTCTVSMTAAKSATATFALSTATTYALTVTKSGTGTGTVTSTPAGITCGSTCSASYPSGTSVTLTATPATGATFTGWGGACTGTGPCTLTMSQVRDVTATFTTSSGLTCPCSVFPATAVPAIIADADTSAVELGMKFQASVPGTITGIRFYKGATNTGTHVGSLWTSTGMLLGRVTFTNETTSGWQQATLPTAVAIQANTTYVVSYHTDVGRYAFTGAYFGAPIVNGPLTALASGASGGNGVYLYGAGGFPTQTYNASNYWVDVVFRP
jgi:hypothetical protein